MDHQERRASRLPSYFQALLQHQRPQMPTSEEHREGRASRLRRLLDRKGCCFRHLRLLLEESVGLPFSSLTLVNFLYCIDCRAKHQQNNTDQLPSIFPSSSSAIPSGSSSTCPLDAYFHEYSAAVASKAAKRALTDYPAVASKAAKRALIDYPAADSSKGSSLTGHTLCIKESIDGVDVEEEDVLTMAPATKPSTIESIPDHLLFGDAVLSHLPLCDIARARFVSRAWMTHIDRALQNPASHMHPCLHYPCLMLLNPASAKIGACAGLSVYDVRLNAWLPKPILFPKNALFLVGASLGLFCFATGNPLIDRNVDFFVGNPLMHAWTCLPRAPVLRSHWSKLMYVTFVASQGSTNGLRYKLLKLFCTGEAQNSKAKVFIYDSDKREWDNINGKVTLRHEMLEHVLLEDPSGLLYFFNTSMSKLWSYDLYMNKVQERHDVEGGTSYLAAKMVHAMQADKKGYPHLVMGLPVVVKCAERLFRVCRMEHSFRYDETCAIVGLIPLISQWWPIKIFRLEDKTRWETVSEMPPDLLTEAVEEGSDGTDFVIGSDRTQHLFFILRGSSKMLAFDVLSSVWKTLPGCPGGQSFYPYKLHAFYEPLMCCYDSY